MVVGHYLVLLDPPTYAQCHEFLSITPDFWINFYCNQQNYKNSSCFVPQYICNICTLKSFYLNYNNLRKTLTKYFNI